MQRQIEILQKEYPNRVIVSDIGSGINFQRAGLQKLLQLSNFGMVKEIVLTDKDRLCRFAFDLIEYIFRLNKTRLLVHFAEHDVRLDDDSELSRELADDILAINTVFACRMQGRRSARNRKARKLEQGKDESY